MKISILTSSILVALTGAAPAALWIDFNSDQSTGGTPIAGDPDDATSALHNQSGYLSYHVTHESAAHLSPATAGVYSTSFALTGAASVSVLPAWTNTTDVRVRQSIGRPDGQANTWLGNDQSLLRDWLGIDSRTTNVGGNGAWDLTTGTPTYMTIALGSLPAAAYSMTSFHHDVENMNSFFTLEISTDGGSTYGSAITGRMTNSSALDTPAENEVLANTGVNVAGGDPADLSSTLDYGFTANGTDNVVLRFAPYHPTSSTLVHHTFFGINGFQLDQVPEPSAGLLGLFGGLLLLRRQRR